MSVCVKIIIASILSLNPSMKERKVSRIADSICSESIKAEIDPRLVVAIIQHESGWNPKIIMKNNNGSSDFGLMQFNCKKDLNKIYLKWRKWWCNPIRRNYLQSIEGGIKAGIRELIFWKKACSSKHNSNILYLEELDYKDLYSNIHLELELSSLDIDWIEWAGWASPYNYVISLRQNTLKNILKHHWWIRHYNWNNKSYGKQIMYIYFALRQNRDSIYDIIRHRHYKKFKNINKCLQDNNLCLKEYREWQKKKIQK